MCQQRLDHLTGSVESNQTTQETAALLQDYKMTQ